MRLAALILLVLSLSACGKESTVAPTPQEPPTPTTPTPTPTSYTVMGTVLDASRAPILGAVVTVVDPAPNPNAQRTATTDAGGRYTISGLTFTGFSLMASSLGYVSSSRGISLTANQAVSTADFTLTPLPGLSFDGLSANGSVFKTYSQGGFTVTGTVGDWLVSTTYGKPAPFIQFFTPFGPTTSAEISVTAGGESFTFSSIDLYSSVTQIPYEISGFLNGSLMFRLTATQGNTFGNFATIPNRTPDARIDTLFVRLTNLVARNPVGLDNIRVSR